MVDILTTESQYHPFSMGRVQPQTASGVRVKEYGASSHVRTDAAQCSRSVARRQIGVVGEFPHTENKWFGPAKYI